MKDKKRILSVTIKRMIDDSPDTSWLGEYANRATSEYSIDREHSLDCITNQGFACQKLTRIRDYVQSLDDVVDNVKDEDALNESLDVLDELQQCDCGQHGDMERNQYQYFNPSFNYVDKAGHALPENTPEEVRKYVRQDYERMEQLNRGDWCFIGVRAEAQVSIPSGTSAVVSEVSSGGLWGIESDSDDAYIESVEKEELSALRGQLKALGFSSRAISAAFKKIEREGE